MPARIRHLLSLLILSTGASGLINLQLGCQEVFALNLNGELFSIDPQSGQSTLIGSTGVHTYLWSGLAQDSQGRLFAATGDWSVGYSIFELDPMTGAGTFVADTPFNAPGSMAFGPGDQLFVANDPKFPLTGGIYDLYTFDLQTAQESLIGSTNVEGILAMDFYGNSLFGCNTMHGLMAIDTQTGNATDLNPNYIGPYGQVIAMCFDENGALYYLDHALWMMDSSSGLRNPTNWVNPSNLWSEAVFREGPSPNFALWLNGSSGHYMVAKVTGATPNNDVALLWAKGDGGPTPIPQGFQCSTTSMDLNSNMKLLATKSADASGNLTIGPGPTRVPAAARGIIWLQAVDLSTCKTSNRILIYI